MCVLDERFADVRACGFALVERRVHDNPVKIGGRGGGRGEVFPLKLCAVCEVLQVFLAGPDSAVIGVDTGEALDAW